MNESVRAAVLILVMAGGTMALRFLPALVFRKKIPAYIEYLGRMLPAAIMGMLVVYCLKDVKVNVSPFGIPELIAGVSVVVIQYLKRNSLLSILSGTVIYMILVNLVF